MDSAKLGLLTTLVLGVFILIGALIAFLVKKKERVADFSIGLAFGVIVMLIIRDLIPELIEHLGLKHIYLFIIFTIIGYAILKVLDNFIPDHDDEHMTNKERKDNLMHIGVMTAVALVLHNIIEGMAVYSTIITDSHLGFTMMLGVGFHNIPLGMVIASAFHQSSDNLSKTTLGILAISLSTFAGGLIMFFLNITTINPIILGILLSITLGMLLFITISELIPRIKATKNPKTTIAAIALGLILVITASFIHIH